ncbi:MAG: hypothetical protein ACKPJJ_10650 [Planctomycetaceae bacterium]
MSGCIVLLAGSAKHSVRSRILVNDCQFHVLLKRLRRQPRTVSDCPQKCSCNEHLAFSLQPQGDLSDDVSPTEKARWFSAFGPGNVSFFPGMKVYEVQ